MTIASQKPDAETAPADSHSTKSEGAEPADDLVTTHHSLDLPGGTLNYTASAGRIVLREEKVTDGTFDGHQPTIEMFVVAYTLDDADPAIRPVTFAFNGGPGSSSVWLHFGLLGPHRVLAGDAENPMNPPYQVVENLETLLRHTDLVFLDPMSTGFTRPVRGGKAGDYHGFKADRDAMAEMIRLWTTRHDRWLSPKFLAGESYGTTRAAALAARLSQAYGMTLNGLILISSVLDFGTVFFNPGNDLAYACYLPTYAALAHYHGKHPDRTLEDVIAEATELAERDYPWALARGSRLTTEERRDMVQRIAAVIGLDPDYVDRANLRVEHTHFYAELRRSEQLAIGRLDGRFTGRLANRNVAAIDQDVSFWAMHGPYSAAVNHYLRSVLNYESDLPYELLTDKVRPWSYQEFEGRSVYVVDDLATAMVTNPSLKVHVAFGYYDGATPFESAEYVLAQLDIPRDLQANISRRYYPAGHMMYLHEPSRLEQSKDLAEFVTWATGGPHPDSVSRL